MALHGRFRDCERSGDFLVALTVDHEGQHVTPAHSRKTQVHERDVGAVLLENAHCLFPRSGLCTDSHIGLRVNDGRHTQPHDWVVIYHKNGHFLSWSHFFRLLRFPCLSLKVLAEPGFSLTIVFLSWRTVDLELPAKMLDSLAHPNQAEVRTLNR